MTNQELQAKLLELTELGTLLYFRGAGINPPPEHFLQNFCAIELIKAGFVVVAETWGRHFCKWCEVTRLEDDKDFRIDLSIWNPANDGNPRNAVPRGIVEFKISPWRIVDDVERTASFLTRLEEAGNSVFGYVIVGGSMFEDAERLTAEVAAVDAFVKLGHGPLAQRTFDETLSGWKRHHGVVIGLPIHPGERFAELPAGDGVVGTQG